MLILIYQCYVDAAKPSSSASGSSKAGQNQAWLLEQAKQELEEEVENLKEERNALLEGLQEERRTRVDVQEYADEEIERLRRQIIGLQSLPDERVVVNISYFYDSYYLCVFCMM